MKNFIIFLSHLTDNKRIYLLILIIGTFFIFFGCDKSNDIDETHSDYSAIELENIISGKNQERDKNVVILKWMDTVDGGDDPMKAGCHMEHGTKECTDNGIYFGGDSCINARKLQEYTDSGCHERDPIDLQTHDCHKLCVSKGFWFGRCKNLPNACGAGNPSAKCKCFPRQGREKIKLTSKSN